MMNTMHKIWIHALVLCISLALTGCGLLEIFGRGVGAICDTEVFTVTKTEDTNDGVCTLDDCSLREAVITANECSGEDRIQLTPGTYEFSLVGAGGSPAYPSEFGWLSIVESLTMLGGGATVDAPFHVSGDGTAVEIRDLTIRNMIENTAELTLNNVRIQDSRSGAILNTGTLTMNGGAILRNSRLARLTSTTRREGVTVVRNQGGLMVFNGTEIANNTLIAEYEGEYVPLNAVENSNRVVGAGLQTGTLRMTQVSIRDNNAFDRWGSAIHNLGTAELDHVTISGHIDYAIFDSGEQLRIVDSSITDNPGGAISADGRDVTLLRTTISGNGDGGNSRLGTPPCGTIVTSRRMRIENSTLSGNHHDAGCPLIENIGELDVVFSTLYGNENIQGAIYGIEGYATTRIQGSILGDNAGNNCGGAGLISLGGNLYDDASCSAAPGPGDLVQIGEDLQVLPLADNGGPTMTHALLFESPAIDLGGTDCPMSDQRGITRPIGSACDAGAFEAETDLIGGTPVPASGQVPPGFPIGPTTCRTGPGPIYPALAYFDVGDELLPLARDALGSWLQVQGKGKPPCWILRDLIEFDPVFDPMELPAGIIPPTPTWTPLPPMEKPKPATGCLIYDVSTPNDPNDTICVPRACTPNDQPGGACTP